MKEKRLTYFIGGRNAKSPSFKRAARPVICTALAAAVVLTAPALPVGDSADKTTNMSSTLTAFAENKPEKIDKTSYRWVSSYGNLKLYRPKKRLDADKILKEMKYEKLFLRGYYYNEDVYVKDEDHEKEVEKEKEQVKKFYQAHKKTVEYLSDKITLMPVSYHKFSGEDIDNDEWGFEFAKEDGSTQAVYGTVDLDGRKLTLTSKYASDQEKKSTPFVYDVEIKGGTVTLSAEGESVVLTNEKFLSGSDGCVLVERTFKGDQLDCIKSMTFRHQKDSIGFRLETGDRKYAENVCGYLGEDGLFDFSWTDASGKIYAYEFVYIFLDHDGLILTDGENTYYYTERT